MRRAFWPPLIFVFASACTEPRIFEAGLACANGVDDDGDKLVDCDDPACADSGHCEATLETCSNDVDEDNNGNTDCEEKSCIRAGFCDAREASCDWAKQTGCVRGLSCIADEKGVGRTCEPRGSGLLGDLCLANAECVQPASCAGYCAPRCTRHADCPRGAACMSGGKYSVCLPGCTPAAVATDCKAGICVLMNGVGLPYDMNDGHILGVCGTAPGKSGTVPEGGECAEPSFAFPADPTPAERAKMCSDALACVPIPGVPGKGICRQTCALKANGAVYVGCPSGRRCVEAFPTDMRPLRPFGSAPGLCLP